MESRTIGAARDLGVNLRSAAEIPELIGAAYDLDGLVLHAADLAPEFLNLRSGLLGELFQKLVTYRKAVAFVVPDPAAHGERFAELAREHASHPQIRFFQTEARGRAWLEAR